MGRPAVVSWTLRKNLAGGTESFSFKMLPRVEINLLFTSEFIPPMDTTSANTAGSPFPPNDIGTDPFSNTITYCWRKRTVKLMVGERKEKGTCRPN
ncbi:hypothetical protein E5676_scaffold107G00330 [Cucumis melo var. makuwa]|uniref:Uncharacterized protein n=1 Tax=Cucumis melo var. makuwa TaxID=1194695 RepID=A0A5D3CHW4_CUCMM|nr:hypothetical protein E5676_scaffold107G00330 [Cucumis melo var. makuwa]